MSAGYTDADVQLVAGWFKRYFGASTIRARDRDCAIEILAALAEAGRLTPDGTTRDLDVLATVGRMYLDALDADPANETLTLPQAMLVTDVRDAVERRERAWVEADEDGTG